MKQETKEVLQTVGTGVSIATGVATLGLTVTQFVILIKNCVAERRAAKVAEAQSQQQASNED